VGKVLADERSDLFAEQFASGRCEVDAIAADQLFRRQRSCWLC